MSMPQTMALVTAMLMAAASEGDCDGSVFFKGSTTEIGSVQPEIAPVSEPLVVKKKHSDVWVEVTRPVLSCGATNDSPSLQNLLLDTLVHPPAKGKLPEGCSQLVVGDKYLLDNEQNEEDTKKIVKMWAGVCPHGCVPFMTPVYAPPRRIVGAYLRPTNPPPGW